MSHHLHTEELTAWRRGQGYKSQGTANVEFISADLATAALQEFNGVHLDGKPMHIHQVMLDPDQLSSGVKYVLHLSWCCRSARVCPCLPLTIGLNLS